MSLVEQLEWDSSFFGFPIGRINDEVTTTDIGSAVLEADEHQLRCTYLLAHANDDVLLESAQKHGFIVRDIRVELERPVAGHPAAMTGLRCGQPEDMQQLEVIARERFRETRFFADRGFPADRSAELYVEWLRKGLGGEPGWVALVANDACGFVLCEINPLTGTGAIRLIGVAASATRQGVGSALVAGAGALFLDASLLRATVVTQGHNVAAQRLYQSYGYRTVDVRIWLHRWRS